jgi:hypothetical protein
VNKRERNNNKDGYVMYRSGSERERKFHTADDKIGHIHDCCSCVFFIALHHRQNYNLSAAICHEMTCEKKIIELIFRLF